MSGGACCWRHWLQNLILTCLVTVLVGNLSNLHNPVRPGEQTQGQFQLESVRYCRGLCCDGNWAAVDEGAGNTGRNTCYLIGGCEKRCNGLQRLT